MNGSFCIRVDSPTDVHLIAEQDAKQLEKFGGLKWHVKEQLSFEELKAEGNRLFKDGKMEQALRLYDRALLLNDVRD